MIEFAIGIGALVGIFIVAFAVFGLIAKLGSLVGLDPADSTGLFIVLCITSTLAYILGKGILGYF